jgi:hypothetical protein
MIYVQFKNIKMETTLQSEFETLLENSNKENSQNRTNSIDNTFRKTKDIIPSDNTHFLNLVNYIYINY